MQHNSLPTFRNHQNIFTSRSTSTPSVFDIIAVTALYKLLTYLLNNCCFFVVVVIVVVLLCVVVVEVVVFVVVVVVVVIVVSGCYNVYSRCSGNCSCDLCRWVTHHCTEQHVKVIWRS